MKIIIIGLGVQGIKRKKYFVSNQKFIAGVDPYSKYADYKYLQDVPLDHYDACFLCVPDNIKSKLITYCLKNHKHILVEKPLLAKNEKEILFMQTKARKNDQIIYSAYNHRFEPHIKRMKKLIETNKLGKIYSCKMFYGNGTARLVRDSKWRDSGLGVLGDLGPHLLDICNYFFGNLKKNFNLVSSIKNENKSPDHVIINSNFKKIYIQLEMSLCMWKNQFYCDIIGEKGSAHIESLCKWGPSKFTYRNRKLPSGKPKENIFLIKKNDPTWKLEHLYFNNLLKLKNKTNLQKDIWILKNLNNFKKLI